MRTSTTVSDTFGDGMIENVESILSGNSCSIHMRGQNVDNNKDTTSRNFDRSRDPRPAPVPPPSEWINWNPWRASHASACLRTISRIGSISSAPETYATVNGLNFSIVDMFLTFCVDYRVKSLMCVCHGENRDTRTSFSPIVSGTACSSHEGIRSEESTDGTATYLETYANCECCERM